MSPYVDTIASLLGVAIAALTLGRFTLGAIRRSEERLTAAMGALDVKFDTNLTGQINALDTKLTGQITALDTKLTGRIDALGTMAVVRLDRIEARVEKLDGRVYVLAAGLRPILDEHSISRTSTEQQ